MIGRRHFVVRREGEVEELFVDRVDGEGYRVTRAGAVEMVEARRLPDGRLSLILEDGRQICGRGTPRGSSLEVSGRRGSARVRLADPLTDRLAAASEGSEGGDRHEEVRTLMPGRVVQVLVGRGDRVDEGALLLVLEAMKMQNEIRAPLTGSVERVSVTDGQPVEAGALLVSIRN